MNMSNRVVADFDCRKRTYMNSKENELIIYISFELLYSMGSNNMENFDDMRKEVLHSTYMILLDRGVGTKFENEWISLEYGKYYNHLCLSSKPSSKDGDISICVNLTPMDQQLMMELARLDLDDFERVKNEGMCVE